MGAAVRCSKWNKALSEADEKKMTPEGGAAGVIAWLDTGGGKTSSFAV